VERHEALVTWCVEGQLEPQGVEVAHEPQPVQSAQWQQVLQVLVMQELAQPEDVVVPRAQSRVPVHSQPLLQAPSQLM
jgi:hypothetical protein